MTLRVIQCFFAAGRLPPSLAQHSLRGSKQGALPAQVAQSQVQLAHGGIDPRQLGLLRGGGQPLSQALLAKMESAFNADFSDVRVHIGPQAGRLGALAFTTGKDLYFAPGQYQPDSMQGQRLIGHELAHVIQQRQGRVRPSASGISVVLDQALEAEADRHGMRAALHIQSKGVNEHQHISRQTGNEQQHMRAGNSSLSIQRKTASPASSTLPARAPTPASQPGSVAQSILVSSGLPTQGPRVNLPSRANDVVQAKLLIRSRVPPVVDNLTASMKKRLRHRYNATPQRVALLQHIAHSPLVHDFATWRDAATGPIVRSKDLAPDAADSGGIGAMVSKFSNLAQIGELLTSITSGPRVKRHNTSAWITGRIKPQDYQKMYVPIANIRSQHSIDGAAVITTATRTASILNWLNQHPADQYMDMTTLNVLAGSSGNIKVGLGNGDNYITLDGVGRVEAIRGALQQHGNHPLRYVQVYAVKLDDDEYQQLRNTSDFFRDAHGVQRTVYVHNLLPYSALPRFVAGTALNILKNKVAPKILPVMLASPLPSRDVPDI